jgi:hypothetical protein
MIFFPIKYIKVFENFKSIYLIIKDLWALHIDLINVWYGTFKFYCFLQEGHNWLDTTILELNYFYHQIQIIHSKNYF